MPVLSYSVLALLALSLCYIQSDRATLSTGVDKIYSATTAYPSAVIATAPVFVFLQADNAPVAAAGPIGNGRAVVIGHSAYFSDASLVAHSSNLNLLKNTLGWLGRKPLAGLKVGVLDVDSFEVAAQHLGIRVLPIDRNDLKSSLANVDVLMLGVPTLDNDNESQRTVVEWTKEGHGLYIAGVAWGWKQAHSDKSISKDLSANRILVPFGFGIADDIAGAVPTVEGADNPLLETTAADAAFRSGQASASDLALAKKTLARAFTLPIVHDDNGAPK